MVTDANPFRSHRFRQRCEEYMSRALGCRLRLTGASALPKSTRDAPWRLDTEVDGTTRSYVLRLGSRGLEHEYWALRAMEEIALPTPRAYGWDPAGENLGEPCFFSDFVAGESLLGPLLAHEPWAEELYIDAVCHLQSISREQLISIADHLGEDETAADVLETAYGSLRGQPDPLVEQAYARLKRTMPPLPATRFSNGDLWPDNFIVRDGKLVGIIDWANAAFSDPIFEFLLLFFLRPEVCGRGLEERYCQRMGFDLGVLPWYRGLEYFDSWHWVAKLGEPFEQHSEDTLRRDLAFWMEGQADHEGACT